MKKTFIFQQRKTSVYRVQREDITSHNNLIIHRCLVIEMETESEDRHQITACAVDINNTLVTFLRSVKLAENEHVWCEE